MPGGQSAREHLGRLGDVEPALGFAEAAQRHVGEIAVVGQPDLDGVLTYRIPYHKTFGTLAGMTLVVTPLVESDAQHAVDIMTASTAADARVRVPTHGRAESLNLATAAAVCLYASAQAHSPG